MKFRIIENITSRKPTGPAKIRWNSKGAITVNKAGLEHTGIKQGDRLMLVQDLDKPNDWYLIKTENTAFSPFRKNASGKSVVANYSAGYNELMKYFRLPEGKSFDINFGGQIKTEFGTAHVLITAPLIEIKRKAEKEVTNG